MSESKYDERPVGAGRSWGFGRNMPDEIRGSSRTSQLSLSDKGSLSRSLAYHTSRRTRTICVSRRSPHMAQRDRYGPSHPTACPLSEPSQHS